MRRSRESVQETFQDTGQARESGTTIIPGTLALGVLKVLPDWGDLVTIVLHGGCVFEFKGPFPKGKVGRGFYNLDGTVPGFHGHLKLDAIDYIGFQDRPHAGRIAHALTFNDRDAHNLFKVFLGRDSKGTIWPHQLEAYESLRVAALKSDLATQSSSETLGPNSIGGLSA